MNAAVHLQRLAVPPRDKTMTSERKKQLIYSCAAEAGTLARIRIRRLLHDEYPTWGNLADKIDDIVADAQHNAGRWAVQASEADTRTIKHYSEITGR